MATSPEYVSTGSQQIKDAIANALENKTPLLISRHGSFEFQCFAWKNSHKTTPLSDSMISILHRNAGIFPKDVKKMEEWLSVYWQATCDADGMAAGWYLPTSEEERALIKKYNPAAFQFPLRSLESYYVQEADRWTELFANRRVTVVSSFANTMEKQVKNAKEIWPNDYESLLPSSTKWSFVRSYYPSDLTSRSTAWPSPINDWLDAVNYIVDAVEKTEPDIVLIGCGGLASPAAAALKKKGHIAIVMGGAIQVLFGIKGGRWKNHAIISEFWNDAWVSPTADETPLHASSVENKCYW
jgi:hypothetical protein